MSTDLEKWVKIRAVLDVAAIEISMAENGAKTYADAINVITGAVSEYFGRAVALAVRDFLEENLPGENILPQLQELLIEKAEVK